MRHQPTRRQAAGCGRARGEGASLPSVVWELSVLAAYSPFFGAEAAGAGVVAMTIDFFST